MDHLLAWLNDTAVKSVLLFLGGLVLARWPAFVSKAIPVVLTAFSAITAALLVMFPAPIPNVAGLAPEHIAAAPAHTSSWLWNTIIPVLIAVATHSGGRSTAQWIKLGVGLIWPKGHPPVVKKV